MFKILRNCLVCDIETEGKLCKDCIGMIKPLDQSRCEICSLPLGELYYCKDCTGRKTYIKTTRAVFKYEGFGKEIIHNIKFQRQYFYIGGILQLVEPHLPILNNMAPELIMPVPFNIKSMLKRGFDLPAEIAVYISKKLKIRIDSSSIVKRISQPQRFLTKEERQNNLKGRFLVRNERRTRYKRILIVDDIMSTGATVNELAKTLLENGARAVYAFVIARA